MSSSIDPSDGLMRLLRKLREEGVEVVSHVKVLSTASFVSLSINSEEQFKSNDVEHKSYLFPTGELGVACVRRGHSDSLSSPCRCVAYPALPTRQQDTCRR